MELKNIRIDILVTPTIYEFLKTIENRSELVRNLLENHMKVIKKRGNNRTIV